MDCPHSSLRKLDDEQWENFQSFEDGARFYACTACGQILKTTPPMPRIDQNFRDEAFVWAHR